MTGGANTAKWQWKNVTYTGFTAYKSGTALDSHAIFAEPLLVNPAGGNYTLGASSPAIDAGENLGSIMGDKDYKGSNRIKGGNADIGADEY